MRPIDADNLLKGIEELKQSPWYNFGKITGDNQEIKPEDAFYHRTYLERKEAIDVIVEQCIEKEPTIETEPVNGWISVKDRLPEDDVSILICSTRKTISKATYSSDMGRYYIADSDLWYNELDITHWQPLPEPPKGG
jgi:hypothetical protein